MKTPVGRGAINNKHQAFLAGVDMDAMGPASEKSHGVDFFVKRDGRWQVVNSQMTTIKE